MKAFIFTITLFLMTFQHAYAAVTTIRCDYDTFASIQKVEQTNEIMQLAFTVDTETSEVQVVRKTGVKDVDLYPTGGGYTFIEVMNVTMCSQPLLISMAKQRIAEIQFR